MSIQEHDSGLLTGASTSSTLPGATEESTSYLRAAALMTLKSKRRKNTSEKSPSVLPSRPTPSDAGTFQLDYGQEENSLPTAGPSAPKPVDLSHPASPTPPVPTSIQDEDRQMREEGEISDTEETEPTASSPRRSPTKEVPKFKSPGPDARPSTSKPTSPTQGATAPPPLLQRIGGIVQSLEASGSRPMLSPISMTESPVMEGFIIDDDHVRPGLAMNQAQYDTAKDIVLDLLGWGVPPEYLVDCGLSRQIVFYVFHELNLRLPSNLDTTSLAPVTPDTLLALPRRSGSLTAPPTIVNRRDSIYDSPTDRTGLGHVPLATRLSPATPPNNASEAPVSEASPPPTTIPSPPSPSLHDIEQQRRQELLARKAVQASRRQKPNALVDGSSSVEPSIDITSKDEDVDMASLVPTETVDDFLNSIGPVSEPDTDKAMGVDVNPRHSTMAQRLKQRLFGSADDMDVDDHIPGLVTERVLPPLSPYDSFSPSNNRSPTPSAPPTSANSEPPPSATESTITSSSDQIVMTERSFVTEPGYQNGSEPLRRGAKRPVAADFVDFEPRPSSSHNGHTNGNGPALLRRKAGSFASVSGMRRCVIDLSDSEDDGEGGGIHGENERGWRRGTHSPYPSMPSRSGTNSSAQQPQPQITLGNLGMSPAALAEKEQEIRRMRELIAQREGSRLKKLAAMSGRSTPNVVTTPSNLPPSDSALVSTPSVSVKQEEEDSSLGQAVVHPTTNGHAEDGVKVEIKTTESGLDLDESMSKNVTVNTNIDDNLSNAVTEAIGEEQVNTTEISRQGPADYSSIFELYPLLRGEQVDDKKWDPDQRICQYEIPGGGICRDDLCQDIHLRR